MKILAQYGAPVYIQDFGEGTQNPNLIGPALPAGFTDFSYSTDLCPPAGFYTLARRININGCFNDEWIPLRKDYSPETDLGMMMIVNNNSSPLSRLLYKDTVNKQLCPGVNYHYSVAIINIDKPSVCTSGPDFPLFDLRIETVTGQLFLGGCRVTDNTYVKMIGTDVQAGPDTSICKGQSIRLRTSTGIKYEWTPATGLSATNINNPVAKPESTTAYTVQVTDIYGCTDTAKLQVKVMNKVKAQALLQGTNDLCGLYDSASFKDISSGIIAYREWDFDNGQTDTTITPPVQYYLTGNQPSFLVRLAIRDTAGCADTISHRIYVRNNCYIAVPSAFTPNGDGLNDELGPLNAYKATNLVFRIYSRSGQLVFETKDWTKNGTDL